MMTSSHILNKVRRRNYTIVVPNQIPFLFGPTVPLIVLLSVMVRVSVYMVLDVVRTFKSPVVDTDLIEIIEFTF